MAPRTRKKMRFSWSMSLIPDASAVVRHAFLALLLLVVSFVSLTTTYDAVSAYVRGNSSYAIGDSAGTVLRSIVSFVSAQVIDPGDIDTYDDPPCTVNCDPATNYKHVNIYLASSAGSSCLTSGCGGVAGDSGALTVNLSQASNATVVVGNSWNGKFRFDSATVTECSGTVNCWLSVSPTNLSGIIKGPKTGNPTTASVVLSRTSPSVCIGGTCTAKIRVSGSIQSNWRGHFKWSCGGGDNPVGACPNASAGGPIQSEYRTITVTYTPPAIQPISPLICNAQTAAPYYTNQDIAFTVTGGDSSQNYSWSMPGGTPASQTTAGATAAHTAYTTTGAKTITVSQAGATSCVLNITVGTQVVPDFSLSIAPIAPSVVQGQSISYQISATPANGFTQTIVFDPPTLPAGMDMISSSGQSISAPPSISGGSGVSSFTLRTTGCSVASGSYNLSFTGRAGSISKSIVSGAQITPSPQCGGGGGDTSGYNCTPSGCQFVSSGATYKGAGAQAACQTACTHKGCSNNACTDIAGSGTNTCTANSQCQTAAFSCSVAWNDQPVNSSGETIGTASVTINNLAAGKTCNFICSPLTGCSATAMTVSGARSYGPFKQGDSLSFVCGTASGGTQTCGTHGAFAGTPAPVCSAPSSNPYYTCVNNACARVDACGISTSGCTSGNVGTCCGPSCGTGTLSCAMTVQPNSANPSAGTVLYTVANSTADTRCTFSCSSNSPTSGICNASVTPGSGTSVSGSYDYSNASSQRTLSLKCQKGTATPVNCSGAATIGAGAAPTCTPSKSLLDINEFVDIAGSGGTGSLYDWNTNLDAQPSAVTGFQVFRTKFGTAGTKTITVKNAGGSSAGSCTVTVASSQPTCVITSVNPDPVIAGPNSVAYVSWTSSNATECVATQGPWYGPSLPPVGTQQSNIISSAQYTATTFGLKCKNALYPSGGPECTRVAQIRSGNPPAVTTNLTASCVAAP